MGRQFRLRKSKDVNFADTNRNGGGCGVPYLRYTLVEQETHLSLSENGE